MFDPSWEEGCPSCSYLADHIDGMLAHLSARRTALAVVSRAPVAKIEPFRRRMGGWLECAVVTRYDGGDHDIVVGEVLDATVGVPGDGALLFHEGDFHRHDTAPALRAA